MSDILLPAEHVDTIREALEAYRDERWFNDPGASDTSLAQRSRDMARINAALAAITEAQRAPTGADGALDMPDSPGWWAFEGAEWEAKPVYRRHGKEYREYNEEWDAYEVDIVRYEDGEGEPFQSVLLVRYSRKGELVWFRRQSGPYNGEPILGYIRTHHVFYNGLNAVDKLIGKWTKLAMPCKRVTAPSAPVAGSGEPPAP